MKNWISKTRSPRSWLAGITLTLIITIGGLSGGVASFVNNQNNLAQTRNSVTSTVTRNFRIGAINEQIKSDFEEKKKNLQQQQQQEEVKKPADFFNITSGTTSVASVVGQNKTLINDNAFSTDLITSSLTTKNQTKALELEKLMVDMFAGLTNLSNIQTRLVGNKLPQNLTELFNLKKIDGANINGTAESSLYSFDFNLAFTNNNSFSLFLGINEIVIPPQKTIIINFKTKLAWIEPVVQNAATNINQFQQLSLGWKFKSPKIDITQYATRGNDTNNGQYYGDLISQVAWEEVEFIKKSSIFKQKYQGFNNRFNLKDITKIAKSQIAKASLNTLVDDIKNSLNYQYKNKMMNFLHQIYGLLDIVEGSNGSVIDRFFSSIQDGVKSLKEQQPLVFDLIVNLLGKNPSTVESELKNKPIDQTTAKERILKIISTIKNWNLPEKINQNLQIIVDVQNLSLDRSDPNNPLISFNAKAKIFFLDRIRLNITQFGDFNIINSLVQVFDTLPIFKLLTSLLLNSPAKIIPQAIGFNRNDYFQVQLNANRSPISAAYELETNTNGSSKYLLGWSATKADYNLNFMGLSGLKNTFKNLIRPLNNPFLNLIGQSSINSLVNGLFQQDYRFNYRLDALGSSLFYNLNPNNQVNSSQNNPLSGKVVYLNQVPITINKNQPDEAYKTFMQTAQQEITFTNQSNDLSTVLIGQQANVKQESYDINLVETSFEQTNFSTLAAFNLASNSNGELFPASMAGVQRTTINNQTLMTYNLTPIITKIKFPIYLTGLIGNLIQVEESKWPTMTFINFQEEGYDIASASQTFLTKKSFLIDFNLGLFSS